MESKSLSPIHQWLTEREVAKILALSVSTLQKQRFKHTGIPYSKFNRAVRHKYEDVIEYAQNAKVNFAA